MILFSSRLTWNSAQNTLCLQANKALVFIYKLSHACGGIPINIACKLFDCMVLPILSYGSEMWGYEQIEKFILSFLIFFLSFNHNMWWSCFRRSGALSTQCVLFSQMSYWLKIAKMSENRIVKQMYIMSNKLDGVGRKNLVSQIRFLLKELRFKYVRLQQGVENDHLCLENFQSRVKEL